MDATIAFPPGLEPDAEEPLRELRAQVRAFIAAEVLPGSHYTESSPAFSRKLGAKGWIGMTWPARWGGHERSTLERYVVTEELIAAGAPIFFHWVADRQSGPLLLKFGSDVQRARFLPAIVRGESGFAIGLSEPGAGSDLAALETRAVAASGGWRISGTKVWTSNAHVAQHMILLGRTSPRSSDRRHGFTQFIVELHAPGIRINPIRNLAGQIEFNEVVLDDVFVPEELVLGQVDHAWKQLISELAFERSGPDRFLSALRLFTSFIDESGPEPTPAEAVLIGRMAGHLWTLRQMSMSVARMLEHRSPELEATIVKDLGNRFEQEMVEQCRALRPAMARGTPYSDALIDAMLYMPRVSIQGGTSQILRNSVARELGLR